MHAYTGGRSRAWVAGALVVTALAAFGLAGCGSNDKNATPSTKSTTASTGAEFEVGNTINYGSFGTTTDLDCGDGKSLNVGGSNNTLTVKGTCSTVSIGGADNKITFDKIDKQLNIVGFNNVINYKAGKPTVENLGSGNKVN